MNQDASQRFRLTSRQQLIHRSLDEKGQSAAFLFESALLVRADTGNPGRLFLAAHSIRMMMDELPKVMDLPTLAEQGRLGDQVSALEPIWAAALKSRCHSDGKWSGEIDTPLQKLFARLYKFFQWWRDSRPKRRDVAAGFFRSTDPSGRALPEPLEKTRIDRWLGLHSYFVGVAKTSSTTEDEFSASLDQLEQILLDNLYRQPSEDFSEIEAILAEEARNA
jgi:hypothetical protein